MPKSLNITVPRLGRNRHGVFFVRSPPFVAEQGRRKFVPEMARGEKGAREDIAL
jgi:hypothetical protein